MHGRLKVKTTAEQQAEKLKERQKKLKLFEAASDIAFKKISAKSYDDEGMEVTRQLLSANSDYSSMWNYRKDTMIQYKTIRDKDDMNKLHKDELSFIESCLRNNPKSYGCWHHRCFVMTNMSEPNWERELELCDLFLQFDERNFHCWDYRRFVTKNANIPPEKEIALTNKIIANNFSNYSSWHYRSKLLPQVFPDATDNKRIEEAKLLEELELVQNAFFTDPNDQSAWFYHRWLLGRGDIKQDIISLQVNRATSKVVCSLRVPVKAFCGVLSIGDTEQAVTWTSSTSDKYSHAWFCHVKGTLDKEKSHEITCMLETCKISCVLPVGEEKTRTCISSKRKMFQDSTSATKLTVLDQELNSCRELNELEPGNKWVVLTLVLLMRAIDPVQYSNETDEMLTALTEIDPQRKRYYMDLRSKYVIEDCIVKTNLNDQHLNLGKMKLTRLCYFELLPMISHLDISNNKLQSLTAPFKYMHSLEVLQASNNQVRDISGLKGATCLKTFFLDSNEISTASQLECLQSCSLQKLSLKNNPISMQNNLESLQRELNLLELES